MRYKTKSLLKQIPTCIGGRGKIRTYDTDKPYTDLDNQRFKPLSHPSEADYKSPVPFMQLFFDSLCA